MEKDIITVFMTITSRLFLTVPGAYSFASRLLANVIPLCVCRDGTGYDCIIGSAPGNRQVRYEDGAGRFTFENAFTGDASNDINPPEWIYVRWKY